MKLRRSSYFPRKRNSHSFDFSKKMLNIVYISYFVMTADSRDCAGLSFLSNPRHNNYLGSYSLVSALRRCSTVGNLPPTVKLWRSSKYRQSLCHRFYATKPFCGAAGTREPPGFTVKKFIITITSAAQKISTQSDSTIARVLFRDSKLSNWISNQILVLKFPSLLQVCGAGSKLECQHVGFCTFSYIFDSTKILVLLTISRHSKAIQNLKS